MEISKYDLDKDESYQLLKILKKYVNLFNFRKKQEYYHKLKHPDGNENSHSCCANKLDRKSKFF